MKTGKVWGTSKQLIRTPNFELYLIETIQGSYCSEHRHEFKTNWFYVLTGELLIQRWKENGLIDITVLEPGDQTEVPPNEWHQFSSPKNSTALEAYYSCAPLENDIIRRSQGGVQC